jgi:hypothetical protein
MLVIYQILMILYCFAINCIYIKFIESFYFFNKYKFKIVKSEIAFWFSCFKSLNKNPKMIRIRKIINNILISFFSVSQQIPSVHQRLELLDSVRPWRNLLWKRFLRSCQIRWRRHHWTGWKNNSIVNLNLSWMANKKNCNGLKIIRIWSLE